MVPRGSPQEGDRERKEQVHQAPPPTPVTREQQKAESGRQLWGGGGRGAQKARSFQRQNTSRHPWRTPHRPQTSHTHTQNSGQASCRGVGRGMKSLADPPPSRGLLPNPQTPVSAKQATFPESHLAFRFPHPRPTGTGPAARDGGGERRDGTRGAL